MLHPARQSVVALFGVLALTGLALGAGSAAAAARSNATTAASDLLTPGLAAALQSSGPGPLTVFFSADTLDHARQAVTAGGLFKATEWHSSNTAVGVGTPAQVRVALASPGLLHAELDQKITFTLDHAHQATREDIARATVKDATGKAVDGTGITVAVVDSGVDGTHPFFQVQGKSKILRNLRFQCPVTPPAPTTSETCFTDRSTTTNDTDDESVGGHGTHVSGIVGGVDIDIPDGTGTTKHLVGTAPGSREVMLSVGASESLLNSNEGFQWVIDHQKRPCDTIANQGMGADPLCPPIRVESNSFGPTAAAKYDPAAAAVTLQRAMVAKGITVVYAAGNSGGTGAETTANTNPPAQDPTGGVVMVAAYDDGNVGSSDNKIASYSSRGSAADRTTWPDISAPGSTVTSSCRQYFSGCMGNPTFQSSASATSAGDFQTISGTSMATPYIAGVAAEITQANPGLTPADVERILKDTAHKYTNGALYVAGADATDAAGNSSSFDKGHGLVDVLSAVQVARSLPTTAFPIAPDPGSSCGGTTLVKDSTGDAVVPVGAGTATSGDITSISFSKVGTNLVTKLSLTDLEKAIGGNNDVALYTVAWDDPQNGKTYATQVSYPDPSDVFSYVYGSYDKATATFGTDEVVGATGAEVEGLNGSVSVNVPLAFLGPPAVPVLPGAAPAVRAPEADVVYGVGGGTPVVTFTGIVDTAPDAGVGQAWSVCGAGGDPNGVATQPTAPVSTPTIPETPAAALLPLTALVAGGAVLAGRRRRRTA